MQKLRPKAVIFDLGSTLIDYPSTTWLEVSAECTLAARRYLAEAGHKLPPDEEFCDLFEEVKGKFRTHAAETLKEWTMVQATEELLTRLEIKDNGGVADEFFKIYYLTMEGYLYLYDDTIETLRRVRESVGKIGLISNTIFPEEVHLRELERFGIAPFLDYTIFSSSFGLRKPHPDIFLKASELASHKPADCVYIGDRYIEDVQGPNGIGMPAVLKEFPDREYPEDMPASVRKISRLSELVDHLDI